MEELKEFISNKITELQSEQCNEGLTLKNLRLLEQMEELEVKINFIDSSLQLPSWEEMAARRDEYKDTITQENQTEIRGHIDLGFKYCYLWLKTKMT